MNISIFLIINAFIIWEQRDLYSSENPHVHCIFFYITWSWKTSLWIICWLNDRKENWIWIFIISEMFIFHVMSINEFLFHFSTTIIQLHFLFFQISRWIYFHLFINYNVNYNIHFIETKLQYFWIVTFCNTWTSISESVLLISFERLFVLFLFVFLCFTRMTLRHTQIHFYSGNCFHLQKVCLCPPLLSLPAYRGIYTDYQTLPRLVLAHFPQAP